MFPPKMSGEISSSDLPSLRVFILRVLFELRAALEAVRLFSMIALRFYLDFASTKATLPRGPSILAFRALLRQYRFMAQSYRAARAIELARAAGFDLCGIAPAAEFPELAHLDEWLKRGHAGEMKYLRDERRRSPSQAMPDARSVIVCALNYNTAFPASTTDAARPKESATGPR